MTHKESDKVNSVNAAPTPKEAQPVAAQEPSLHDLVKTLALSVAALTKEVADLKKPAVAHAMAGQAVTSPSGSQPVKAQGYQNGRAYTRINRGYPVKPGQTWHDLTAEQRKEWFINHENRWKAKFTERASKLGAGGEMNWTRG